MGERGAEGRGEGVSEMDIYFTPILKFHSDTHISA